MVAAGSKSILFGRLFVVGSRRLRQIRLRFHELAVGFIENLVNLVPGGIIVQGIIVQGIIVQGIIAQGLIAVVVGIFQIVIEVVPLVAAIGILLQRVLGVDNSCLEFAAWIRFPQFARPLQRKSRPTRLASPR